jgi:hypothetical protein
MAWNDLAPNQMVSFNDIQESGINLKPGQVAISTDQCITKEQALTMYSISTVAVTPYANNQLIPKSVISYINCSPSIFTSVSTQNVPWTGLASAPNGDVYAITNGGDIYKQTGGTGAFIALNQTTRTWSSIAAAPNGDIYAVAEYNPAFVYKQTGGIGDFIVMNLPQRPYISVTVTPNGDVYLATQFENGEEGDIYKQTGGVGAFISLNQRRYWLGVWALPSGDVIANIFQGNIYKQVGGTGPFIEQTSTSGRWLSFAGTTNGDVYAGGIRDDIYKQTAGVGSFTSITNSGQPNIQPGGTWYGMTVTPSGNIYASDVIADIYKATIVCIPPGSYRGVLFDFVASNPQIYTIEEFGPFTGYQRLTLDAGNIIREYNWAPTVVCSDTPASTFTVPAGGITFAKYAIWNTITVQVVGEFWMDATIPSTGSTWQSSSTKKYSPLEICI